MRRLLVILAALAPRSYLATPASLVPRSAGVARAIDVFGVVSLLPASLVGCGGKNQAYAPIPTSSEVKPGQLAISKPDKHGLVTMLQPIVTHLAKDDPMRIALHWASADGPLKRGDIKGKILWDSTLRSMTFHIKTSTGRALKLKPQVAKEGNPNGMDLYYAPTFMLTLTGKGIRRLRPPLIPWVGGEQPALEKTGVFKLHITGSLVRKDGPDIPFTTGTVEIQRTGRGIRDFQAVEKIAREKLKREAPGVTFKSVDFIRDDKEGNRLVSFRQRGKLWSYVEHTVKIRPDGKVLGTSQRQVFTCIAEGTLIDTEEGRKPVEQVQVGDRVWSYHTRTRKRVLTTVRVIRTGEADHTLVFRDSLRVTPQHPLFNGSRWKRAQDIHSDDRLLRTDLKSIPAGTPRIIEQHVGVYDLTVDAPHNYFAGGFLVHNKSRIYSPKLDDPWYRYWPEHLPEKK